MRLLCVGRHPYLSEHFCRFFADLGFETTPAVGLHEAACLARAGKPDAVVCDFDVLTAGPLDEWERDRMLAELPLVGVSLTRRSSEMNAFGTDAIAGVLYLPTLDPADAYRLLRASSRRAEIALPSSVFSAERQVTAH